MKLNVNKAAVIKVTGFVLGIAGLVVSNMQNKEDIKQAVADYHKEQDDTTEE